jgi:hypothetical protein
VTASVPVLPENLARMWHGLARPARHDDVVSGLNIDAPGDEIRGPDATVPTVATDYPHLALRSRGEFTSIVQVKPDKLTTNGRSTLTSGLQAGREQLHTVRVVAHRQLMILVGTAERPVPLAEGMGWRISAGQREQPRSNRCPVPLIHGSGAWRSFQAEDLLDAHLPRCSQTSSHALPGEAASMPQPWSDMEDDALFGVSIPALSPTSRCEWNRGSGVCLARSPTGESAAPASTGRGDAGGAPRE